MLVPLFVFAVPFAAQCNYLKSSFLTSESVVNNLIVKHIGAFQHVFACLSGTCQYAVKFKINFLEFIGNRLVFTSIISYVYRPI